MPETILIDAQAGTLPEGFCPKGPGALQEFYNQIIALTQFSLAVGIRFYNFGDTEPTADFRVYPWLKTVSGFPERWYAYIAGQWLWPHSIPPGPSGFRAGWVGTEPDLQTYDGGEVAAITLTTGPFWEVDHDFDGRSPMGPGTIPGASPAKALSAGEDYGNGAQTQTSDQIPAHTHKLASEASITNADGSISVVNTGGGSSVGLLIGLSGNPTDPLAVQTNTFTAAQEPTPIIHPVHGMFQIKRTIRQYFRGT